MKRVLFAVGWVAAAAAAAGGCAHLGTSRREKMLTLAAATTKVSKAVESSVRYKGALNTLSSEQLLSSAIAHDPSLLSPLEGYQVHAGRQGNHGVVLVCSNDGKKALLEDAGCTAAMDRHAWKSPSPMPCEFALDLTRTCGGP